MADNPEQPPPPQPALAEPPAYAPLPPEVVTATLPPALPAPPRDPHAAGYWQDFQLAQRLRFLRAMVQTRANNATLAMRLAAGTLLFWSLFVVLRVAAMFILMAGGSSATPDQLAAALAIILSGLLMCAGLAYGVMVLATAGRVFPYHYRLAWQRIIHENDSILLADEERLRILQDNLPGRFWGAAVTKQQFSSLLDRLEFGAFHLPSLRELARNPERVPRAALRRTEVARRYVKYFDQAGLLIGCCVASPLIGVVGVVLLSAGLGQAPSVVQAYARLAAFIDFYLEQPQIDVSALPPPVEPQGWWAKTTAPWHASA